MKEEQSLKREEIDEENGENVKEVQENSNLKGDYSNVAILLFLYLLQGIPLGISMAIPILLQNRGVSYAELAGFTFAFYPFTMKILWAPIVDSVYIRAFGMRKSWLVPAQFLIAGFMIFLGQNVDDWLGDGDAKPPQMVVLTTVFFFLWLLTATQDIAVDGWALTMLQRKNVGHAATCNSVGQTAGGFLGYVLFLVLESKDFANKYIFDVPRETGLVTLSGFMQFWGVIFFGTTVLIAIFKKENSESADELDKNPDYGIKKAYPMLWKIVTLKPVMKFSLLLLTAKVSFAAVDGITTLKFVEYGIPKDKIAMLSIPLIPIQILLPFIISRFTAGPYPMKFYIRAFPFRLIITIIIAVFVYYTPQMIKGGKEISNYYYATVVTIYLIYQVPLRAMYVADMAFMARVSDPLVGASYMTLLNTVSNLGGSWVKTFFMWFVDIVTWKSCVIDDTKDSFNFNATSLFNTTYSFDDNKCVDKIEKSACIYNGGRCNIDSDGYYTEVVINVVYGIIWYQWAKRTINFLQELPISDWHVLSKVDKPVQIEELEEFEGGKMSVKS